MRLPKRLALATTLSLLLGTALFQPAAHADPIGSARDRAAALRVTVDKLTIQVEIATEAYDEAQSRLADAISRHLLAQRQVDSAAQGAASGRDAAASRVRALYRNGGSLGLLSTVLSAQDIGDALNRYRAVQRIMSADTAAVRAADQFQAGAVDVEVRLAGLAAEQRSLQAEVDHRASAVRGLLDRQSALLAAADATVLRLAEAQRQAAQRAAEARAAALLASLGALGTTAPTPQAAAAVAAARTQLGKPYLWGATGPDSFDCSGLTGWAFAQAGVALPRTSRQQWLIGRHVSLGELAPGDLLFWADDLSDAGSIHHVAIYAGAGRMLAAPHSGDVVKEQPVYLDGYMGAARPVG